ncbi:hypothetical protein Pcinc_038544 [Petrolisthes cinctipes]|uniref:Uncharacterized protein n=1 Tax=Petrolisthes cinctipes TaxID=88211 RepID=A0AAE1BU67_PETCI|nr:hypothetical protein Pcinc_038544 [Petrolisthes cinctipes]
MLVGDKYNSEQENRDICLTHNSFTNSATDQAEVCKSHEKSLQDELSLTAMLFATLDADDSMVEDENLENEQMNCLDFGTNLEDAVEMEGLRYVGGYIASKVPQYGFLGSIVQPGDKSWIGIAGREPGKLMVPSSDFFTKLKSMETLFQCHHGEGKLMPGKNTVKTLVVQIVEYVALPEDVIKFFVRCHFIFPISSVKQKTKSLKVP